MKLIVLVKWAATERNGNETNALEAIPSLLLCFY